MKKILLIDSSYPINVRNVKIIKTLESFDNIEISVVSWNRNKRENIESFKSKEYSYSSDTPYGSKFKKIIELWSYTSFIKKQIKYLQPDYIIASHWDMLFIASFLKKKTTKLIYENLDIPTAENKLLYKILCKIEKFSLKKTDIIFFASRFFSPLYSSFKGDKYIIENKPFKNIDNPKPPIFTHNTGRLKVSFIGGLRYFEVMKNLISAVKDLDIDLLFFGDGPEQDKFKDYAKDCKNVFFFGRYDYGDIKCIYDLSDLVWAVYPSKDPNVKYAISNKFFESIVFSKPSFYSDNTELGDYVSANKIGFKINPYDTEQIKNALQKMIGNQDMFKQVVSEIEEYKKNNILYWEHYEGLLKLIFR